MRFSLSSLSLWLVLTACSGRDPILERAEAADEASGSAASTASGQATAPPKRGRPAEPKAVQPPEPPPAAAEPPASGSAQAPTPVRAQPPPPPGEGPGITLSGSVVLDDHKGGPIRVDVFDGDQKAASGGGKRPGVIGMARLDAPGPFQITLPAGTEQAWLGAFADEDQDGKPGPLDPEIWYAANPVAVTGDVSDIQLVLERREPPPKP